MIINKATAYHFHDAMLEQIRACSSGYERKTVAIRNLLPGDILVRNGETVRQVFDHIFGDVDLPNDKVLVQFTNVTGLSVIGSDVDEQKGVKVFRPIHEDNCSD